MTFKPLSLSDGILLYAAQYEDGNGDFIALLLREGYVEFVYNLGSGKALSNFLVYYIP